ncbi:YhgE/Pip domain-containing protein [Bifidobacterium sp. ESL0790]|uniref:YhgE/Pip domain-containing protein n=1 Tax=Bifidobacterium sp. ESL0790 TaxID=2983233 RepID=UPI0023F7CAD1|nr:YhgE/Pip domain-containing protein [Bifidobacterium sp. ESL0790]WEV72363.1 YhgE/Pip domain-containing protein [Bifidobacterium sp. ESL0790]
MHTVMAIVRRDIKRLLRVPEAWVVLFGLVFIPPLYAWFNIAGFWNPYGNTQGIQVTVVNNDRGANAKPVGKLNMGDQIVKQLKGNKQMGWNFADENEAMRRVESGESYAAIVIPKNFSARTAGVLQGESKRPTLEYYVNEKANALASRITDTGASTVDSQVNETFVATVSKVISGVVNKTGENIDAKTNAATADTIRDLRKTQKSVADIRADINELTTALNDVPNKTKIARGTLQQTQLSGARTAKQLGDTSTAITQTQAALGDFAGSMGGTLDQSSSLLSQASSQANLTINSIAAGLTKANGDVGSALTTAKQINHDTSRLIDQIDASGAPGSAAAATNLREQNQRLSDSIDSLSDLNSSPNLGATVSSTVSAANGIDKATQTALANSADARKSLASNALPQLNNGLTGLSTFAATSSANLTSQQSLVNQSSVVLTQLDQACATASTALSGTDKGLANLQNHLSTIITDILALSSSSALGSESGALGKAIGGSGKLDATKIADFMLSPTVLDTKVVYPVKTYGSGMAPLFTNLTLWVGAFMLVVLMKLDVDDDDLEDVKGVKIQPTPSQRYWGRWTLFALIASIQAIVTVLGELAIGVQCHNVPVFIITAMLASVVYVSITYSLSTSFMHVGKALCVGLVIIQIPGSSGMYPIEMMPKFFRALYPYFPFTYSINALRETIAGFYHADWFVNMGKLMIFAVLFFILGLVVQPHMGALRQLVDRELAASDIFVNEPSIHKPRQYRVTQVLSLLADKTEYRMAIERRAHKFALLYPKIMRSTLVFGIAVPLVMGVILSLTNGTRVIALAAWLSWFLITIIFLVAVEAIRDSLARQVRLGNLDDEAVRTLLYEDHRPLRGIWKRTSDGTSGHNSAANAASASTRTLGLARLAKVTGASAHSDTAGHGVANGTTTTVEPVTPATVAGSGLDGYGEAESSESAADAVETADTMALDNGIAESTNPDGAKHETKPQTKHETESETQREQGGEAR